MDNIQLSQENQYKLPYHYIPAVDEKGFSQASTWSWGMHYLGGIEAVLAQVRKHDFNSLVDIGCGDGRFLREAAVEFPAKTLCGVDYSDRAIQLAQAMNPGLDFRCINIIHDHLNARFDIATMIEVLEHIPPDEVSHFLKAVSFHLNQNGVLVLTVPHENKRLQEKHYQHFSVESLVHALNESFIVDKVVPFDRAPRFTSIVTRLLGYKGNNYVITNKEIMNWAYKRVLKGCLEPQTEKKCSRLLAVAHVRNA